MNFKKPKKVTVNHGFHQVLAFVLYNPTLLSFPWHYSPSIVLLHKSAVHWREMRFLLLFGLVVGQDVTLGRQLIDVVLYGLSAFGLTEFYPGMANFMVSLPSQYIKAIGTRLPHNETNLGLLAYYLGTADAKVGTSKNILLQVKNF